MVPVVKTVAAVGATRFWILALLVCMMQVANSQPADSTFTKKDIKQTTFEYFFSYYNQNGDHSAVTGGTGTEKLTVFLNRLNINHTIDSSNTVFIEGGIDMISSASTDNIDFIVSSESANDNRLWVSVGYQRNTKNNNQFGIQPTFSIESDYLSVGLGGWYKARNKLNNWRYGLGAYIYADDLRWGRLSEDYRAPVSLVYPIELADSAWFDIYMRYSYNLELDVQHDINRRMSIGFFPGLIVQTGLLSTPFHRFYFAGADTAVVENLPTSRVKIPLGLRLNSFIGARVVLQLYYRFYWDDFGIKANTVNLEVPIKVTPQFTFTPFIRWYTQTATSYFYPYKTASRGITYYTSDYDLSQFTSFKIGAGIKFLTVKDVFFRQVAVRYAHYSRSDGLSFNQISSYFNFSIN